MPLKMPRMEVWLNLPDRELTPDTPPDHVVTITTGDQLRGELEQGKLKLPGMEAAPMNASALWLWAAMARLQLTDLRAGAFLADPPEFAPVRELVQVDPTPALRSASA